MAAIPNLPPHSRSTDTEVTDDGKDVKGPIIDIGPWVEKAGYIFAVVGTGFLVLSLSQFSDNNAIVILLLLIVIMVLVIRVTTLIKKAIDRWGTKAFETAASSISHTMEFMNMLMVFVVTAYAITLLGLWFGEGVMSLGEMLTLIIVLVLIAYTFYGIFEEFSNQKRALEKRRRGVDSTQQATQQKPSAPSTGNSAYGVVAATLGHPKI